MKKRADLRSFYLQGLNFAFEVKVPDHLPCVFKADQSVWEASGVFVNVT